VFDVLQNGDYVSCDVCQYIIQNSAINAHKEEHEKSFERARKRADSSVVAEDSIDGIAYHLCEQIRAVPGVRAAVYH